MYIEGRETHTQRRGVSLLASGEHELIIRTSEHPEKIVLRRVPLDEIARRVRGATFDDRVEHIGRERR